MWCLLFEWQVNSLFKCLALIFSLTFYNSRFRQNHMPFILVFGQNGELWKETVENKSCLWSFFPLSLASFLQLSLLLEIGSQLLTGFRRVSRLWLIRMLWLYKASNICLVLDIVLPSDFHFVPLLALILYWLPLSDWRKVWGPLVCLGCDVSW